MNCVKCFERGIKAEARLAAKRAARAEARDIRMRELERQQKEEDSERARYSHRSSHHRPYLGVEDALSIRSLGSHRNPSKDITGTHWSRASTPKRKDIMVCSSEKCAVLILCTFTLRVLRA
ncbi:leucine-rich repeat flightless-interacting protein 2-like isoform X2 [Leptonychotes weddellii]|uniref:Leucine-rich repeat flightless-interacting protein 2 n=1 Tax=Leptonychotes weddellii TaxID=9713 RepID=A0A7F8QC12_LEPWE|nr:leucine-rich repeat flightless-interacting protein 2-like isoform X2 [Leptonychotes weddellii]